MSLNWKWGGSIKSLIWIIVNILQGDKLLNAAPLPSDEAWRKFPAISCAHWSFDNVVLMGDAAHTAHFSIGSGTKLAFEDAISLADLITEKGDLKAAFGIYEDERRLEVIKLQSAARNSTQWFEDVPRYTELESIQFAYSLLTRSQRVSHENLRRQAVARRRRILVRRARHRKTGTARGATDVHALHVARHGARQSRRRLADGDL